MRRLIALGVAGAVLVVLVVAQLVLPGLAANRVHDQLSKGGTVESVKVSAFPAIKLLWGHADSVVIHMSNYRAGAGEIGTRLGEAANVGKIDATVEELDSGLLTLRHAMLRKRGSELIGTAIITQGDLRSAVPFIDNVQPVASADGQLVLRGTATLLGLNASVDVIVAAQNGALVVAPNVPFGGLATITLFNDPNVRVQSVAASPVPGGFEILARAQVQ